MQYSFSIALVVKVIDNDIFEGMGEAGEDGHATGCEISIHCLGTDEGGKLLNIVIRTSSATYEEALIFPMIGKRKDGQGFIEICP